MKKKFKIIAIVLAVILVFTVGAYLYLAFSTAKTIANLPVVTPVSPNAIKTASTTSTSTAPYVEFQVNTDPAMTDAERIKLRVPKQYNVKVLRRDAQGNVYDYKVIK